MDIKDLDKKQLILITLLITFVVSIATGIVTVSLMNQMPKSVPQTINNVIQKTIERVTTVETPTIVNDKKDSQNKSPILGDGDAIVSIYMIDSKVIDTVNPLAPNTNDNTESTKTENNNTTPVDAKILGEGIIISDIGLILVETSILNESQVYKVILNEKDFDATILKKFSNGFTILKISEKKAKTEKLEDKNTVTN